MTNSPDTRANQPFFRSFGYLKRNTHGADVRKSFMRWRLVPRLITPALGKIKRDDEIAPSSHEDDRIPGDPVKKPFFSRIMDKNNSVIKRIFSSGVAAMPRTMMHISPNIMASCSPEGTMRYHAAPTSSGMKTQSADSTPENKKPPWQASVREKTSQPLHAEQVVNKNFTGFPHVQSAVSEKLKLPEKKEYQESPPRQSHGHGPETFRSIPAPLPMRTGQETVSNHVKAGNNHEVFLMQHAVQHDFAPSGEKQSSRRALFNNANDIPMFNGLHQIADDIPGHAVHREKNIFPRSSHFNRSPPANAPRQASDKHGWEETKEPLNEQQTAVTGEIWIDTIPLQEWFQDYLTMALNGESFKDGLYDADL